jgi:hypothetical protein
MEVDESQKDSNEKLVQLYKDSVDKRSKTTSVRDSFNEISKQSHKYADTNTKPVMKVS